MIRAQIVGALLILGGIGTATGAEPEVPRQLFGVTLGNVYDLGVDGGVGTLPVKRFTGLQRFLGSGIHYYFEPAKEYSAFPYIEKPDEGDDWFPTSFRLYLLPVIPPSIESSDELTSSNIAWKAVLIEWSLDDNAPDVGEHEAGNYDFAAGLKKRKTNRHEDYLWALDLCATFKADLGIDPKIIDYRDSHFYECTFADDERVLEVSSNPVKTIQLRFSEEVYNSMEEEVENRLYQLKADKIRPY